jgi:RNA polymerase sigma factor (sigma-70 family)
MNPAEVNRPSDRPVSDDAVLKYLPLAQRIAEGAVRRHNVWRDRLQENDIVQELSIRLIDLVERFDSNRGIPLKLYLIKNLGLEVNNLIRAETRKLNRCSREWMDDAVPPVESEGCTHTVGASRIAVPRPVEAELIARHAARQSLQQLTDADREIVELYYWGGFTQPEIAQRIGRPQCWVSRSLARSLKKLRAVLHNGKKLDIYQIEREETSGTCQHGG